MEGGTREEASIVWVEEKGVDSEGVVEGMDAKIGLMVLSFA